MTNGRPQPPLRWLRRALVLAMLLVVGAVGGLFYLGRSTRPRSEPVRPAGGTASETSTPSNRDAVVVTEGFEYEQQVEGKPVFRIRGDRMTTDRGGKVELEEVGLELYRSGEPFTLRSRRAVYDRATGEAQLEGEVELQGAHGWQINADRLDLIEGGKTVVSGLGRERVRFRRGEELHGNAGALRFTIEDERLELSGGVRANGREGEEQKRVMIDAQRLVWQRDSRAIEAEGEVALAWGKSRLRSERLDAILRADEGGVETAEATGSVRGELVPEVGSRVEFAAGRCATRFEGDGAPSQVDLWAADAQSPARVEWASDAGRRTVVAPEIRLSLAGGTPSAASASGGVELQEKARPSLSRRVRSSRLDATFDGAGAIAAADLVGDVELVDGDLTASGDEAKLLAGGERMRLTGTPARARSPRGEMTAPRLSFERASGRLVAEGGVRARFEPESSPLPAGEAASAREPVNVDAKSGTFFLDKRGFLFEGQVQAVQGSSLLFADRLEGDETSGVTTATGKVRTIWQDRPEPAGAVAAAEAKSEGPKPARPAKAAKPAETIATAESLVYSRTDGVLRYAGDVRVRQEPREIRASEVVVTLADDRRAERLQAKGAVVMSDSATGQTVQGDEAEYDLAAKSAVVTGAVVAVKDRDGNVLRGKKALFDLATGDAKLVSGDS